MSVEKIRQRPSLSLTRESLSTHCSSSEQEDITDFDCDFINILKPKYNSTDILTLIKEDYLNTKVSIQKDYIDIATDIEESSDDLNKENVREASWEIDLNILKTCKDIRVWPSSECIKLQEQDIILNGIEQKELHDLM